MKKVNTQTKLTTEEAVGQYREKEVLPLEWRLYPLELIDNGKRDAMLTGLYINNLEYGVVGPQMYEEAVYTTVLGAKLMFRQIAYAQNLYAQFKAAQQEMPLLLLSVPIKVLLGKTLKSEFSEFMETVDPGFARHICFLFNNEVLFIDPQEVSQALNAVRAKGIRLGLEYFGEEYFAPLRLKNLKLDYVLFAEEFSQLVAQGEETAVLLAEMAYKLGYKCIMQNRVDDLYRAYKREDAIADYYQVHGRGMTFEEYAEKALVGNLFEGIPQTVIDRYGLEGKDWKELCELLQDISLNDSDSQEQEPQGEQLVTVYVKSFEARLIQSDDELKANYKQIKEALMSYTGIRSAISWQYESFFDGRNAVAKLSIRGKTLCLYLNLRPKDYTYSKYKVKAERGKKYKQTPCRYDITGPRKAKYALELIAEMYQKSGIPVGEPYTEQSVPPYEETSALIGRGLIKVKQEEPRAVLF